MAWWLYRFNAIVAISFVRAVKRLSNQYIQVEVSNKTKPGHIISYKIACAPSEHSDLPVRMLILSSLCCPPVRRYFGYLTTHTVPCEDWSDCTEAQTDLCADVQADLSLRWEHMQPCRAYCGPAQMTFITAHYDCGYTGSSRGSVQGVHRTPTILTKNFSFGTVFALLSFRHHLKRCFCLAFYFKGKYFVLIGHILSETICLFCFCVLFSKIYPKIKFTAKHLSDLCTFYSKMIFFLS